MWQVHEMLAHEHISEFLREAEVHRQGKPAHAHRRLPRLHVPARLRHPHRSTSRSA
jgi:hypothetical protein